MELHYLPRLVDACLMRILSVNLIEQFVNLEPSNLYGVNPPLLVLIGGSNQDKGFRVGPELEGAVSMNMHKQREGRK